MILKPTLYIWLIIALSSFSTIAYINQPFNSDFYNQLTSEYGVDAVSRARQWQALLESTQADSESRKIKKINDFFNQQIIYKSDIELWKKKDYWASPAETIGQGQGDCEDYVIAKFFSLIALGIPEEKLRLMYVRQLQVNQPHMVLLYTPNEKSKTLVLDNFNPKILPTSLRRDLKPIYSFNGQGLWTAKSKSLGKKVKNSRGVSAWTRLVTKIERNNS
jgi:predicted transglutaminase-like cysteine proteinase